MKARRRKLIEQQKRRQFLKTFVPYFAMALLACAAILIAGCAVPKKKDAPHSYRVELGKKCVEKADGTVAWSYVWIARDDVVLITCK